MSIVRVNFSKVSNMKERSYMKAIYYFVASFFIEGVNISMVLPVSFEFYWVGLFAAAACSLLFLWNLILYRALSLVETITQPAE